MSLNQVLMRSLNTSITALLPVASLLVLGSFVLGATTLEEFALALLIGLFAGAYSSIFIASPLLAVLKEREPRYRDIKERVAARRGDRRRTVPTAAGAGRRSPAPRRRRPATVGRPDGRATLDRPTGRRPARRAAGRPVIPPAPAQEEQARSNAVGGGGGSLRACPRSTGSCPGGATSARRRTRSRPCWAPTGPGTPRRRPP